eukprot:2107446-Pyramimonas_sp.AAC.1
MTDQEETIQELDIFICGFSCKDISVAKSRSTAKTASKDIASALASGIGSSAETLTGLFNYIDVHKPRCVLMENVTGVLRTEGDGDEERFVDDVTNATLKNKDFIKGIFTSFGYALQFQTLNAMDAGMPQSRRR